MAVQNSLANKGAEKKDNIVEYMAGGMKVTLTPSTVRKYLVSGNKETVTIEEVAIFINLCKFAGLNPWLKEAYCIKYGSEPATMVVGKEAFEKRAEDNPAYDGDISGIIVQDNESGEVIYRTGTLKLAGETIIGGFAEVWRKDRAHSTRIEVSFDEYAGRKKDGTLNGQWSKKPATMIRKVALVQALREAFPKSFTGMYTAEEQGVDAPEFTVADIPQTQPEVIESKPDDQLEGQQSFADIPGVVPDDPAAALFGGAN